MNPQLENLLSNGNAIYDLDELVHEAASSMASSVNNAGTAEQVQFLRDNAGWSESDIATRLSDAKA